tara:strand:- start:916 stop:1431 length:516 start_codon:yes stop_codon:yes gene_type:complete
MDNLKQIEDKFGALNSLDKLNRMLDEFNLEWLFSTDKMFNKISEKFIKETGILGKDVFLIQNTKVNQNILDNMTNNETIEFGAKTTLTKLSKKHKHNYRYDNKKPLVFGPHIHVDFDESLTPLKEDIILYEYIENDWQRKNLKVGQTHITKKGIKHAVIFPKENSVNIDWT